LDATRESVHVSIHVSPRSGVPPPIKHRGCPRGPMETAMEPRIYPQDRTAYLLIDPYNDYLSEGGKIWPRGWSWSPPRLACSTTWGRSTPQSRRRAYRSSSCRIAAGSRATAKTGIISIPPARHCSAEGCVPRGRADVLARLAEGLRRAGLSE
jgi:hypothetical protein